MNFRKGSNRKLTTTLHPSEWSLSLEIMCMHFILSGHHTSLPICNHIYHSFYQICDIIFQKWGGVEGLLNFSENSSVLVAVPFPKLSKYVWHAIGENRPFDWENLFCPKTPLKTAFLSGQKSTSPHFERTWRPNCWHQFNFWGTPENFWV